tara:strand:- start:753 stop:1457 length:705 start_codon:yes stop_codon:yes gene_type:complete
MFSIIIPTLNEESIISQTIKQFDESRGKYNFEIIVSDSLSKDNTVSIAKNYADKVIVSKYNNCNISKARNHGAIKAKYNILIFLDADILINNTNIFFSKILNQFKDKNIIASSPKIYVYPSEETWIDSCVHFIISVISNILNNSGFSYSRGGCQIIRRQSFNKINGYSENLIAAEDVDIFRKLRKIGRTGIMNNLKVYESPRRYRKEGYINVLYAWFMNWLYTLLFNRSFSTKW